MSQESPLFAKTFDLVVYLFRVTDDFPRSRRAVLGRRIQESSLRLLDLLLEARKGPTDQRAGLLAEADLELDRLRYSVRLCQEIDLLSRKQGVHAAALLGECGRLLGAWVKRYNQA
ncbi:MAG: four helix bundle protein [Caldilineaceae bacterium]|nr:four helix bundle protein [Caldilineaceae bacterium]